MGSRRLAELFDRYGREAVQGRFDAIVNAPPRRSGARSWPRIVGTWTWEDYAEHDGVGRAKLHAQRITLTRVPDDDPDGPRLVLDFIGTSPQAGRSTTAATMPGTPQEMAGADPAQSRRHTGRMAS
jgi:N-methylhydantoinase B